MHIRTVKTTDTEQLMELCKLHANYENQTFNSNYPKRSFLNYFTENPSFARCIVAEEQGKLVGYATFILQYSTWQAKEYLYLDCLFFKKEVRRQGLGTKFMERIMDFALSKNCDTIQWQTPHSNKNAIQFYQRIGAKSKLKERFHWHIK